MADRSDRTDAEVVSGLQDATARWRASSAKALAIIAEIDARGLHEQCGYDSVRDYCIGVLHADEDEIDDRIAAARAARKFPVLFRALAEGRLHEEAIAMLAPHLTRDNVDELVAAATHRREGSIRRMLVQRFGQAVDTRVMVQIAVSGKILRLLQQGQVLMRDSFGDADVDEVLAEALYPFILDYEETHTRGHDG